MNVKKGIRLKSIRDKCKEEKISHIQMQEREEYIVIAINREKKVKV